MAPGRKSTNHSGKGVVGACNSSQRVISFLLLATVVVLFILIFLSMYRAQRDAMRQIIVNERFDGSSTTSQVPSLILFSMPGCPYCAAMDTVWTDFTKKHEGSKKFTMKKVLNTEVDGDNKKYGKFQVTSYPTIVLEIPDPNIKDNKSKIVSFSGERSVSGLDIFLDQNNIKEGFSMDKLHSAK